MTRFHTVIYLIVSSVSGIKLGTNPVLSAGSRFTAIHNWGRIIGSDAQSIADHTPKPTASHLSLRSFIKLMRVISDMSVPFTGLEQRKSMIIDRIADQPFGTCSCLFYCMIIRGLFIRRRQARWRDIGQNRKTGWTSKPMTNIYEGHKKEDICQFIFMFYACF